MPKPKVSTTFNAVDKMTKPMKRMIKSVKKFAKFALIGAGVALAGVAVGVNKFAAAGDEVAKTARKLGLSVEALQELRFAADRSGVSGEAFSDAMKKMNKNIGDLRVNTGMLTTFLNKQNPALAEQLRNVKNNEEAFKLLTEEISKTENPFDRAALAQAAFGRAGQDLIVMMENGSDGIKELREEARKYGNIISTEAAEASEKFVDSLTNMKNAGLSLRNKALGPLIDKLQPLIQRMADFIAENDKLISQGIDKIFTAIGDAVRIVADLWNSGLIPAVLAGAGAFLAITKAIALYKGVILLAKAAQIAFNIAMAANPIGLIIIGIAALVAAIVWMVINWKKVVVVIKNVWGWLSKLLDNPIIAAAALIFAPFIAIPLMILKHWEPIKEFFIGLWDTIKPIIQAVGGFFKSQREKGTARRELIEQAEAGLLGKNDNVIQSQSTVTNRSQLDVTFNNTPQGTSFRQRGRVPDITVNDGFQQARF